MLDNHSDCDNLGGPSCSRRSESPVSDREDGDFFGLDDLLPEPESPLPAPYSFSTYEIPDDVDLKINDEENRGRQLVLRLVGSHPLWGHHLWNTARVFSTYLQRNPPLVKQRRILELGAGAALPSIACTLAGARQVVITDYPDNDLVENMRFNVDVNIPGDLRGNVDVVGHLWGHDVKHLMARTDNEGYELLILSDLVFNHSQHDALIKTVNSTLSSSPDACVLVFFTSHRPHLVKEDNAFFPRLAASGDGWVYQKVVEEWAGAMFEDDPGDEKVRGTVHGWKAWRVQQGEQPGEIH
ncbi:nicotinamide N-methyltransferase [Kwoniella mangroviensis CBS 8886]|nr:nicotinamide N-methyltransferase [Kwoniella mangroviensis CBS 8886]